MVYGAQLVGLREHAKVVAPHMNEPKLGVGRVPILQVRLDYPEVEPGTYIAK